MMDAKKKEIQRWATYAAKESRRGCEIIDREVYLIQKKEDGIEAALLICTFCGLLCVLIISNL